MIIILLQFTLIICINSQDIWSKTWDAGNTGMSNKIKSSHLINDTLYYVTFNVCNYDGEMWNECNTIGMMDMEGSIIKETKFDSISIKEGGSVPWLISNNDLLLIDGTGTLENANYKIHNISRNDLNLIESYKYYLDFETDQLFMTGIEKFNSWFVLSGIAQKKDCTIYPDILVFVDTISLQIDTIIEYPFHKESVIPEFLFVDPDSLLTVYWSGIGVDNGGNSNSGGRGFMKIDRDLNVVSNYIDTIDTDTKHQYPHSAYQLSNGNMVYKQQYDGEEQVYPLQWLSDYEIVNIDKYGNLNWRFNRPGWSPYGYGEKEITHITESSEGDILACGYTRWHTNWHTLHEFNLIEDTIIPPPDIDTIGLYYAPYILKLDGETGELLWQYSIIELDEYGNNLPYVMRQIHELSDGSLIGTGWSRIFEENGIPTKDNSWVIHLPADGCIRNDGMECGFENYVPTSTTDPILIDMSLEKPFVFYPNPSNGEFHVLDQRKRKEKVNYIVTDVNGATVKKGVDVFLNRIDLTEIPTRIFYISIFDNKVNSIQTEILVKR